MLEVTYLAFIPDVFQSGRQVFFVLEGNGAKRIDPTELSKIAKPVISLELKDLFDQLRFLGLDPPNAIIDLEQARKLAVGISAKKGGKKYWNGWSVLRAQKGYREEVTKFRSLFSAQLTIESEGNLSKLASSYLNALRSAWVETVNLLKEENEYDRFFEIEAPIQYILNRRQNYGIKIDLEELEVKYATLREEKYKAYIRVANALNVSPSGFTFRNVRDYLTGTELEALADGSEVSLFEQKLKMASQSSVLAKDIICLLRSDRDLKTLSKLSDDKGRSYPSFTSVGTISGRILVRNPYIQGIRKEYRSVISPDTDLELIYLDYDQFEPGILASLSKDKSLIELYNSGDIYTELARIVFNDEAKRSQAKQVFISFLYGMSEERIAQTLYPSASTLEAADTDKITKSISLFFSKFADALAYREQIRSELFEHGRLATALGGHRKRSASGPLSNEESRWALSQRIQGTGSLIFKEAALLIEKELEDTSIILPMHDAFLLQFDKASIDEGKELGIKCMQEAMRKRCPNVDPKVSVETFAS